MAPTPGEPVPRPRSILCPYCGEVSSQTKKCAVCGGLFEPLSRQATQNAMGPWYIRDPAHPFRPGCSYQTILAMIRTGKVGPATIIRGPTTRQFWTLARRAPGIGHLFGMCHGCQTKVEPDAQACPKCGVSFVHEPDRQRLGLGPVRLLPGQAPPEAVAHDARAISPPPVPRTMASIGVPPSGQSQPHATQKSRSMLSILWIVVGTVAAGILTFWAIRTVWEPLRVANHSPPAMPPPEMPAEIPSDPGSVSDLVLELAEPERDAGVEAAAVARADSEPADPHAGRDVITESESIRSVLRDGRLEEARRLLADAGETGDGSLARSIETIEVLGRLRRLP